MMYMIVGLGNPGKEYVQTKHNAGFWVIDAIAREIGVIVEKKQCQALTQTAVWEGKKILLVKPQTYMNLSGQAVMQLLYYYADRIDDILVIHDDLDLDPGVIRFKQGGGGSGGHNGIKSIAAQLNSNNFDRLKLGIGRGNYTAKDYVLTPFQGEAQQKIKQAVEQSVMAVNCWMQEGIGTAMNKYNIKKKSE